MKNWTFPVCLCLALFTLFSRAQEQISISPINNISTYLAESQTSIIKRTEKNERHSYLLKALRATELDEVLDYDGQFTVFAPSNVAFAKLSELTQERLMDPKNKKELRAVLSYHIIAGNISASKILKAMCRGNGKATFTTVQGDKITATMNGIDIVLTDIHGNKAKIVSADSNQCNGVIHEIDSVFLPVKI
ncbi:fasciclin domain-containing protein [Maribacter sp. CXY002]|uniref:fasciclin domain-containing protein n=1 Tax=Maribacter luteocoastalis TaxID=3407671 RepID=UPI003B66C2BC